MHSLKEGLTLNIRVLGCIKYVAAHLVERGREPGHDARAIGTGHQNDRLGWKIDS